MEINYEKLKDLALNIPLKENGEMVKYRGRDYFVAPFSQEGPEGEFFPSTAFDGADIYLWERVPKKFKRSVFLHELVEADLCFHQGVRQKSAHDIAVECDRKFARDTLDSKTYEEYENFRENAIKNC